MKRIPTLRRGLATLAVSLLVAGCAALQPSAPAEAPVVEARPMMPAAEGRADAEIAPDYFAAKESADAREEESPDKLFRGTGRFVKKVEPPPRDEPKTGDVTLNFENTDLREVVKVVLGDLLQLNYVLDPGVRGGVTMQTGRPLSRDVLLPTLETLLRMNGAAMVVVDGVYHVMPLAKAPRGNLNPQLADASSPLPSGFSVQVVPLRYIGAEEMTKILQPLVVEGSVIQADPKRNLLVLAGTGRELRYMLDTIETFDVDWIKGLSVGFFQLQHSKMDNVLKDLEAILGGEGGAKAMLGGMIRVMPIESVNGLLVVTQRPEYLDQVAEWIKRLDLLGGSGGDQSRLFVYRVRNGDAEKLAGLLDKLFEKDKKSSAKAASVAPGLEAKKIESAPPAEGGEPKSEAHAAAPSASGSLSASSGEVKVVADVDNNTLLISAAPRDYENILRVLEQLDIVPLQVHIEATIVEVALTGELKYGVQWFFKTHHGGYLSNWGWDGTLDGDKSGLGGILPGFNWNLVNAADQVRAAISLFAGDTNVNILSAPSVMVLDNQKATIQVGDQVPIATQQQQSTLVSSGTTSTVPNIVNSIQYRDTGIMLSVKPRVNPGGLVTMEIDQEVSTVAQTTSSKLESPTIKTRKISSKVAVQTGQAVVLGGLIRDEASEGQGGVPGLYELPVVGNLFGETRQSSNRTELLVVLTPRVIGNARDAQRISDDLRNRMKGLKDWH